MAKLVLNGGNVRDVRASVADQRTLVLTGLALSPPRELDYVVAQRCPIFATPSRARTIGVAPAGMRVRGSACKGREGWVEIEEGFILEAALQIAGRPQPLVRRFRKAVELPHDADLARAVIAPTDESADFAVRVPRKRAAPPRRSTPTKQQAPAPAPAPTPVPAPAPAQRPPANASAKKVRRAADRNPSGYGALPVSEPVLVECAANDEANVQWPAERVEEWRAMPSGGFKRMSACV